LVFVVATGASLTASAVLVRCLETIASRARISEAALGLVAATAANSPEITSAVTALAQGQHDIGIGVILGSNVFNLAALLGAGALVAGAIRLHRDVIVLAGIVGLWAAVVALAVVTGWLRPPVGLLAVLILLGPYVALSAAPRLLDRIPLRRSWIRAMHRAVTDEEADLEVAIHPRAGGGSAIWWGVAMIVLVVLASTVMERSAATWGAHYHLPQILTGGILLAAITSLPNGVAALYLASRGRGAAVLSEAMNSNTLNVVLGFLVPTTLVGLPLITSAGAVVAAGSAAVLTACAILLAYRARGLGRRSGAVLILGYLAFLGLLLLIR
jgi:cation:H+ antiporter